LQKSDDTFRLTVSQPKLPSLYMCGKVKNAPSHQDDDEASV